jgi:uncharacterized iron-regulated membrane protein
MVQNKKKTAWQNTRKVFNEIHLWMGIGSGIIIFLVCLSGTIYTFSTEIKEMLEPDRYEVAVVAGAEPMQVDALVQKVEEVAGGKVQWVGIPADPARTFSFNVKKDGEKGRGTTYMVNPYTASLLGSGGGRGSEFFMSMFRLHRWLLLDSKIGRPIVGVATIIFVFIVLTGLVIWFPRKIKFWKQGLKIKTDGSWKRTNHDLHNTLGFYSSFLLLIMALTGLCWSFGWYKDGLSSVLGAEVFGGRREKPMVSTPPDNVEDGGQLKLADFVKLADSTLPYEGDYRLSLPHGPEGVVAVSKNETGFFASAGSDRLQFDQYSGELLKADIFAQKAFNEKIAASIKPLHMGDVFGTFSKIIYFIACLVATSLPVTGTIIWINKLRKKKPGKKVRAGRKLRQPAVVEV